MSANGRAVTTLIVSDDRDTTSFLESSLSTLGFDVVVANGAMQALEELHSRQFDLVLSEFKMPRLGGEALWDELERRAPWALRSICFLTSGYTVQGIESFLHRTGARYLEKPFTFDQL